YTCNGSTTAPADVVGVQGYIARCRTWYTGAVKADSGNSSVNSAGLGTAVLSTPFISFISSSSTGQIVVTGSQAFYNSTGRVGVVSLQIRIDDLTKQVSGVYILSRGYVFLIDVTSISWVEFTNDTTLTTNFFSAVNASKTSGSSPQTFYKSAGGESWSLAAASVPNSNYVVVAKNYEAAEVMMVRFKNERGRGVCLNNKGNVFKQLDNRTQDAIDAYSRAILIAETLIASETDLERRRSYTITLAGRLSNLGVLYKDLDADERTARRGEAANGAAIPLSDHQQKAVELLTRALELHRSVDNVEGIAQTSGNLGQLYLDVNDLTRAEELIRDAYDIVRSSAERMVTGEPDPIAMQCACMNIGHLADRSGRPKEAVTWYTYVLQRFSVVVAFVQRTNRTRISAVNRPELARAVREVAAPLFVTVTNYAGKNVWFVLDVSGSMTGSYIRACRASIKEIIAQHCTAADSVGLTTFSSSVTTVLGLQARTSEAAAGMLQMVEERTDCYGWTAFYSAMAQTLHQVKSAAAGRSASATSGRIDWVVALTDGEDNASNPGDVEVARQLLRGMPGIGLVVITVGQLRNVGEIQSLLDAVSGGPRRAVLIGAEASGAAIHEAFGKAVRVITGHPVVEWLHPRQ
ncbi:hypothetical protein HK405_000214, partial [Cladochytrium tenue]